MQSRLITLLNNFMRRTTSDVQKDATIRFWDHLMNKHTKRNEHGLFEKNGCVVCLGVGTNCGLYYTLDSRKCANKEKESTSFCFCKELEKRSPVSNQSDGFLEWLWEEGFVFYGWLDDIKYSEGDCTCYDLQSVTHEKCSLKQIIIFL